MNYKILIVLGCMLLGSYSFSQDMSNEERATEITKTMQTQIGFNEETYAKVYDVNLQFVSKNQELKQRDVSKFKKFKALRKNDKKRKKALKDILTKDEYKAFKKHRSDNRSAFKDQFKATRE